MAKVSFKDACMKLIDRTESGEFDPLVAAMPDNDHLSERFSLPWRQVARAS